MAEFNSYLTSEEGWTDNTSVFIPSAISPTSSPTYSAFGANGLYALLFAQGDIAFINFHHKHDVLVASDVYFHVHFSPSTTMTAGQTVIWTAEFAQANRAEGESLTGTLTSMTLTYTADGTEVAGEHLVVECLDADAFTIGDVDSLVLFKVTLGTGTFAGDVFGHTADLHYKMGRLSTPNKASPFV